MSNPLTDLIGALTNSNSQVSGVTGIKGAQTPQSNVTNAAGAAAAIPNAYSSVQNALSGFYDVLTNGKMWRSLGWTLLGVVLLFIAILLLIGPSAERAAPLAAAKAALL
jgi:hypothetical protein